MLEWLFASVPYALIYSVAKDVKAYLKWEEKTKLVDREWTDKSGFQKQCEADGIKLGWGERRAHSNERTGRMGGPL